MYGHHTVCNWPVDYKFWDTLQEWVYETKIIIMDVHDLPECIVNEWDKLDQHIIDKAVEEWQGDFELVWLQAENKTVWT